MSVATASAIVTVLGAYFAIGFVLALVYALGAAKRIDPDGAVMTWGARLIIMPGVAGLWPLMLVKLFKQTRPPVS